MQPNNNAAMQVIREEERHRESAREKEIDRDSARERQRSSFLLPI